jgi:hypothetical protein
LSMIIVLDWIQGNLGWISKDHDQITRAGQCTPRGTGKGLQVFVYE